MLEHGNKSWCKKVCNLLQSYIAFADGDVTAQHTHTQMPHTTPSSLLSAVERQDSEALRRMSKVPDTNNTQMIYIMCSLTSNKLYVGRTNNLYRRYSEHLRDALSHLDGKRVERVHAYMARNDPYSWFMVPVFYCANTISDAKVAERRMINLMNKNRLLNDDFKTRARNCMYKKSTQSTKNTKTRRERTHNRENRENRDVSYHPIRYVVTESTSDKDIDYNSTQTFNCYDLCAVMSEIKKQMLITKKTYDVTCFGTYHNMTNWKRVRFMYGYSKVSYPGNTPLLFKNILRDIKQGNTSFTIHNVIDDHNTATTVELESIAKSEAVARRTLRQSDAPHTLYLRANTHRVRNEKLRQYAKCAIDKRLLALNINYNKPITMRVPYTPGLSLHVIRDKAFDMIDDLMVSPILTRLLKRKVRVVFTKRQSIGDSLNNYSKLCKSYSHTQPCECVCKKFPNLPKCNGHVAFKATDIQNGLIKKCLHVNSKNILTPTRVSVTQELEASFTDLQQQLRNVSGTRTHMRHNTDTSEELAAEYAGEVHVPTSVDVTNDKLPTTHDIRKLKHKYKGLTFSNLDKNGGCMFICCPCYYEQALKATYTDNNSYTHPSMLEKGNRVKRTVERVHRRWATFYDKHKYTKWFPYPRVSPGDKSKFPSAYILAKNKDIKKFRPIVSYFKHPFKRVLNAAGRALQHLLSVLREPHFNLSSVSGALHKFERINDKYKESGLSCICLNGDLANMYTSLDHKSIRIAVKWLLAKVQAATRRHEISVPISKNNDSPPHLGRSSGKDHDRITFTFDELLDIVNFDLSNAMFCVGDTLLKQVVGIPMGSPISPSLAQIICAYYESQVIQENKTKNLTNPVEGVRYVDDLTAFIFYNKHDRNSYADAKDIASRIQYGYHKDMELEVEDTLLPFKFLSSMMTVCANTGHISAAYHNKNYDDIIQGKAQTFPTYQHYSSYAPPQQKKSVVISTIHRIGNACNSVIAAQAAFNTLCSELHQLEYPCAIINRALCRVRNVDDRWRSIVMPPESAYARAGFPDLAKSIPRFSGAKFTRSETWRFSRTGEAQ